MIPELQRNATSPEDYVRVYDRNRRLQMPLAGPLSAFGDVSAPGYEAFRFTGQGGDHNLVFLRTTPDAIARVVTLSIVGNFDEIYPRIRPDVEQMLEHGSVRLRE
jgi:hypothetical protein